jgi:cytochrome c5
LNKSLYSILKTLTGLLILVASDNSIMADSTPDTTNDSTRNLPNGEVVFQKACFSCHGTGFYGAPVIGDTYDWEERLIKGEAVLLESTLDGMNSMPARGGCATCSDIEIHQAVRYLIENSTVEPKP